jgi:hypothetical protein
MLEHMHSVHHSVYWYCCACIYLYCIAARATMSIYDSFTKFVFVPYTAGDGDASHPDNQENVEQYITDFVQQCRRKHEQYSVHKQVYMYVPPS